MLRVRKYTENLKILEIPVQTITLQSSWAKGLTGLTMRPSRRYHRGSGQA